LRQRALVVPDKAQRVANYHRATIEALAELTAAAGLEHPGGFHGKLISRRVSQSEVVTLDDLYPRLMPGDLIAGTQDKRFKHAWELADADSFAPRA
jgi:hypothetical protein